VKLDDEISTADISGHMSIYCTKKTSENKSWIFGNHPPTCYILGNSIRNWNKKPLFMPTYHYRCKSCQYEFDELQKISESRLVVCPQCHKNSLSRIIGSGAGIVFKGSGFYITDYKGKKSSSPSSASPKSENKKDQKPPEKSSGGPNKE
jgi:putative FmdB family regulatory protein